MASFTLKFMFFTIFYFFCLVSVPFLIPNPSINLFNQHNNLQESFNISDLSKKVELRIKNGRVAEIILPEADPESYRHSSLLIAMFAGVFVIGILVFAAFDFPQSPPPPLQLNILPTALLDEELSIDDFSLGELIGQGRFMQTYYAEHSRPNKILCYAVRMLNDTPLMRKYVEDEVKVQGSFKHRTFLRFLSYFYEEKVIYMCLDYAPYGPITNHLDDMDEEIASKCILDVVEALIAAHEHGILHAKVTAKKLYIGITCNVQIADFGYCIHEARREHEEVEDIRDVIAVTKALLAKKDLSPLASDFVSAQHNSLASLLDHGWISTRVDD